MTGKYFTLYRLKNSSFGLDGRACSREGELLIKLGIGLEHLLAGAECHPLGGVLGVTKRTFHHTAILCGARIRDQSAQGLADAGWHVAGDGWILQTDDKARTARITLASGTAHQLAVDSSGFVKLGGDHVQPS